MSKIDGLFEPCIRLIKRISGAKNSFSSAHHDRMQESRCNKIGLFLALIIAPSVQAHPHSWIDLKTYIQGKNGMITSLKMEWTFDAMTSAYMLDGKDMSAENEQSSLQEVSASVLENMLYEHYFTYFYDAKRLSNTKSLRKGL